MSRSGPSFSIADNDDDDNDDDGGGDDAETDDDERPQRHVFGFLRPPRGPQPGSGAVKRRQMKVRSFWSWPVGGEEEREQDGGRRRESGAGRERG